jgi:poly [ADP-ribose] polymerase 2/3/4
MRKVFLIFVAGDKNHNKIYNMTENADQTFTIEYGRVGNSLTKETYPIGRWNSKYSEKIRKGYKDVTDLYKESDSQDISFSDISPEVKSLFETLMKYTGDSVKANYNFNTSSVTQTQIDQAQKALNQLATANSAGYRQTYAELLFSIFPRKMYKVADYIPTINWTDERLNKFLTSEQDILDSLKGQVIGNTSGSLFNTEDYNVQFSIPDELDALTISSLLGKQQIKACYSVRHLKTDGPFVDNIDRSINKTSKLLLHGSRPQNILSIFKSGLMVRPTNGGYNGSAYGDGIYHADKIVKSLGYCGYQSDKFIMIQQVHTGKEYEYVGRNRGDKSSNFFSWNGIQKEGYDSVFAKGGNDLLNNEYIVYRPEQTTIKYLLWL